LKLERIKKFIFEIKNSLSKSKNISSHDELCLIELNSLESQKKYIMMKYNLQEGESIEDGDDNKNKSENEKNEINIEKENQKDKIEEPSSLQEDDNKIEEPSSLQKEDNKIEEPSSLQKEDNKIEEPSSLQVTEQIHHSQSSINTLSTNLDKESSFFGDMEVETDDKIQSDLLNNKNIEEQLIALKIELEELEEELTIAVDGHEYERAYELNLDIESKKKNMIEKLGDMKSG